MKDAHPFWTAWSSILARRPMTVIAVCLVIVGASGVSLWHTPFDLSFLSMLGENEPEIVAIREQAETFGSGMMLILVLEGEPQRLDEAIDILVEELPKQTPLKAVRPPADPQWLIDRAPWLWPDILFERVTNDIQSGIVSDFSRSAVDAGDTLIRKTFRPDDNVALLSLEFYGSPLNMAIGGTIYKAAKKVTEDILDDLGAEVKAEFTGIAAIGAQDQIQVLSRIKLATPLTLIFVLLLVFAIERRISRVLITGVALASSVVVAYGMVGLVLGRLTLSATFFGMLLLGLGIDFGIHLLVSLRDGRAHGLGPEKALEYGVHHTGTAIVLGGVSTGLAFGLVALTPDAVARPMGLSALFGLGAALLLMLSFVPAAWLLLERRHKGADASARLILPGLSSVVSLSIAHPKKVLLAGFALAVLGLTGIPRYTVETDLEKIFSRNVPAIDVARRLQERFGGATNFFLAEVDSVEQAREWSAQLEQLPDIARVVSVADFIPENSSERADAIRKLLESTDSGSSGKENLLRDRLRTALDLGPITLEGLPPIYTTGVVGVNGELAVRIVPKEDLLDAQELSDQIDRIREIAPKATGMAALIPLATIDRRDFVPIMVPSILAVVTLVLAVAFRNRRDVFLALLPVLIGSAITFGFFFWIGLQFSVLTSIVVPVLLGLGVDDGIHVVERLRRYRRLDDQSIHEAVEGVGRPIFLTTSTTCVSFAGLLITDHAGLESIALFMLMGLPVCFITSITVLPAAAKLFSNREAQ